MGKFFLLSFLFFILGLFFAYRLVSVGGQKSSLPEFGPIDFQVTLEESPKFSSQFQIIETEGFRVFTDIYPRYQVGDVLSISGEIKGEGLVFNPKIVKLRRKKTIPSYLAQLREKISGNINSLLPAREAALVKGMVLGVDDIEKNLREQLIATGTIHAVVVSGQNLSIVAGFFMVLVKHLGRKLSMLLSLVAVIFYAGLTGFEVPVVRALIMVILSYLAVFLGRERLAIWYLLLSAAIIVLIWPTAVFDVSFQLTFAATVGIMTLGQKLSKTFNSQLSTLNLLLGNASVATSAYLFTAPIIFLHFGKVSLIAPLVNVLVAEAIVPIMLLGFGVAISSLVFMPFAQVVAYLAYVPAFYFVKIVELFGG